MNSHDDGSETLIAVVAGVVLLGGPLLAVLTGLWDQATGWLLEHRILAADHVILEIPGGGGAGADLPRLLAVAVAFLLVLAGLIAALRRRAWRRQQGGARR